jgi:hypothetical protein
VEITKEDLLKHIENMYANIEAGETCGSVVELIALGVPVKVDLADLSYGAVVLLDGDSWFKEESNSWSCSGRYMSQLDLAQWIRDSVSENVVLLYNGDVYK